jgi:hypothetical protein
MINIKNLFRYALPTGLTTFCWLTMRTVASFSDESMTSYGFPFPWYAAEGVSSMGYVIAIGPILADLIVYVAVIHAVMSMLPQSALSGSKGKLIAIAFWLAASSSLFFKLLPLSIGPQVNAWTLNSYFGDNARRS